jgi:hypothetical protein
MINLKHVGKIKSNGARVLVAFRTLPGESDRALVVPVTKLNDDYHNSIMKLVETTEAQAAFEFGEIMFVRFFPDGRPVLKALQQDSNLVKIPTDDIIMVSSPGNEIALNELNALIAEQRNCAIDDLCNFVAGAPNNTGATVEEIVKVKDLNQPETKTSTTSAEPLKAATNEVLNDKDIAKSYRSQADALYKEAAKLRKDADELDPPAKKATKVKESADA